MSSLGNHRLDDREAALRVDLGADPAQAALLAQRRFQAPNSSGDGLRRDVSVDDHQQ
jgi:hypothetical protein